MKAILIDVLNQDVKEVEFDNNKSLTEIYKLIKCEIIEVAMYINENDDCIYVDEEGLLEITPFTRFFSYKNGHQPFAGNGLIIGTNMETGDNADVTVSLDEVKANIKFLSLNDIL